ncbi:MAG: DEAD/DEAH box helicase family protein, partial [Clostridium sp.]|nr:DEAD/DEAH box helicase family protein [Clostridium sp.]
KTNLAEEFLIDHVDAEGNPVQLNLQESFILWAQNSTLAEGRWRGDIDFATANISREELGEELSFRDIIAYIDGDPVKADKTTWWDKQNLDDEGVASLKAERKKEADLKRQARSDTANRLFDRYLHEGLTEYQKSKLAAEYNRKFNSYIIPDYSKLPLFVEGMSAYKGSSKFKLYDQQIKGISFLCNKGNGLLAYDVGVGKTAAGIVATVNQIQTGRSKRPLIVVPNQVYSKWYTDIRQLFPNIPVNDLYNFNKDSVSKFVDSENPHKLNIPVNSISICTYEALKNITFTDQSCENELYQDFANLLSADFDGSDRENAEASDKIKGIIGSASHVKDANYYFFEDCGFDNLTVDEAHNFKNLWVVPKPKKKGQSNEYAGIPSGKPSARALKMYGMTQLVQRNNDDRNVFMLTATPFTNSPTEVYSMLSYIGRERLREAGISSLRSFFDEFAQTKQELGVTSTGNVDTKQVMKSWKELPALQSILTEFIDKVDGEEAGIIRPNKFTHVKPLDMSELQKQMREVDEERMAEIKEGNSAAIIVAMNNMRLSCVAPALANPAMYPDLDLPPLEKLVETSPKLKFVCDAIIDMYKDNPEKGQFMYVPLGKDSHGIIKDYLVKHGIPKEAVEIINGEINNTPEKKEKITAKFNDEKNPCKIIIGGRNTAEGIDLNGNSFVMYNCSL